MCLREPQTDAPARAMVKAGPTGTDRPRERGGGRSRRPFDRLALAGAMDAKTSWFRSMDTRVGSMSVNYGGRAEARPLGDTLPAGATDAGNATHLGAEREMGTGL